MKNKFKNIVSNCLDDSTKDKSKLNKNYYFVSTIFFIALNILIFAFFKSKLAVKYQVDAQSWDSFLNFKGLISAILNNLSHWRWSHVLLNMFPTFIVISIFLERKFGSLKHFLIVTVSIVVSAAFVAANHQNLNYTGWSCVNFCLMGFTIVSYFFSLNNHENTNANLIYSTLVLIAIFIFMWWEIWDLSSNASSASCLTHNMGHYSGFLAGLIIGLIIYLTKYFTCKSEKTINNKPPFKTNYIVNLTCNVISISLIILSLILIFIIK